MTKRTFFKSIMGAVAAVALAPEIAFGRQWWSMSRGFPAPVNPEWVDAPFEVHFWIDERAEKRILDQIKLANLKPYHELQAIRKAAELSRWP